MLNFLRAHLRYAGVGAAAALLVAGWLGYRWLKDTALPPFLHTQLTAMFQRDVSFQRVDLSLRRGFTVEGVSVAKGLDPNSGKLFTMKALDLRFNILRLAVHWRSPQDAIKKVILQEPSLEIPLEQIAPLLTRSRGSGPSPRAAATAGSGLPPLPKSYLKIENASLTITRRGVPVLEVRRLGADLDLRDQPRITGGIRFTLAPDARVALEGTAHFSLKEFKGGVELESLDLGQLSDLARMIDPRIPTRVGGRLDAKLEVVGGFFALDELLDQTAGHGSLKLQQASLDLRGNPLITGLDAVGTLDGRQIELETLSARVLSGALSATGSLGNLGQGRLRLRGRLDAVPVRALRALSPGLPESLDGVFSFEFSASGTGTAPVFTGRIASPGLGVPGVRPEGILAEMTYSIGEVVLTNLRTGLWGGAFQGAGAVTGLTGSSPEVRFDLAGTGFDVRQSPIGGRGYGGTASLEAKLAGPPDALTGSLDVRVAKVTALGRPVGDLTAAARFEAGVVSVTAATASKSLAISGALSLPGGVAFRGIRLEVRERLPTILAIAGVEPHPGLDGMAAGSIRLEGSATAYEVSADVVGSAIRLGKVSLGDVVRIPAFTFRRMTMEIPEASPARLEWGDHATHLELFGSVPVGVFTASGQESMQLAVSAEGRLEFLERLNLVKKADGTFKAQVRLGGTAAMPVWEMVQVGVTGRRLALKERIFDREFDGVNLAVYMKDDEGEVRDAWVGLDRQRQTLAGRFGMRGWKLESVEMTTRTTAEKPKHLRGLPLALEDIADVRVLLNASVAQRPGGAAIVLTGPDPELGAELTILNGTITYAGPRIGEGAAASSATTLEEAGSGRAAGWWDRLNFLGTVTFGRNLTYAPRSAASKAGSSVWKLLTGDREALRKLIGQYASKTGMLELFRQQALGFDLRIREGSSIRMQKEYDPLRQGDILKAFGEVALEPGGKVTMGPMTFTLVDEPGLRQRIEFPGSDPIEAHVELVAETTLYDKKLPTETGEVATVEELRVRLVLTPPDATKRDDDPKQQGFMQFKTDIVSEPEKVSGEVAVAPTTGSEGEPAAQPQTRSVTFKPGKGSLMLALFGLDSLASVGQTAAATGGSTVGTDLTQSAATGVINAILSPIRKLLGLDVLSVRKSELANRRRASPASTTASAGSSAQKANAFDNTELTAGVALTRNLFLNQHVILLDATGLSSRGTSGLTANQTSPTGFITELEFRRSTFKIKTKGRWFGLPDDPQVLKKYELFGGIEVNQNFQGVSNREPFVW